MEITRQAFDVLLYLIENRHRVVSREELLDELWSDRVVTENALSQALTGVRRAIGDGESDAQHIHTLRGRGLQFVAPIETLAPQEASLLGPDSIDSSADTLREPERRQLARAFGPMLSDLYGDLRPVRLFAATRQSADAQEVSVVSVYTALDITLEVAGTPPEASGASPDASGADAPRATAAQGTGLTERMQRALQGDLERETASRSVRARRRYRRRVHAVEAAAVLPRLVIVGPPGSGKSTFAQHLALCLAGSILGYEEANAGRLREWVQGTEAATASAAGTSAAADAGSDAAEAKWMPWERARMLPVFVELGRFAESESFPQPGTEGTSHHLFAYLALRRGGRVDQSGLLEAYLQERAGEGVLLILDGLDETPVQQAASGERDPGGTRERLKEVIRSFVHRFARARAILTSRPYAYEPGSPWRLENLGFEAVELANLSADQVRSFCRHWYVGMAERRVIAEEDIEARAAALLGELEGHEYLAPLVERPLTLTMLADLHTQDGALPSSRAALYEESATLFLNRWNAARRSARPGENRLTVQLRIGLDELRRALNHLGYHAHRAAESGKTTLLRAGDVIEMLFEHGAKGESERILDFLSERSGILVADSRHQYRFPHRSYQEYLAACHLTYREFPARLVAELRADPQRWREVAQLALGRMQSIPYTAVVLIQQLLDPNTGSAAQREFLAYLCASGVEEAGLREAVIAQDPAVSEQLRRLLLDGIQRGALAEHDRVRAGEVLGQLGDPRVAALERVEIAGGSFWMGAQREDPEQPGYDPHAWSREGPVQRVDLSPFALTRYPVTVSQFAGFVAGSGYQETRFWDPAGRAWRELQRIEAPSQWHEQQRHPNRPVVGVSWYEAHAFATWTGGSLPSEAQWEFAARGGRDWRFPWGNEDPTEDHAAFGGRFSHPVPVGLYPRAAERNPWHLHDLAGNVGEWCHDTVGLVYPPGPRKDPADRLEGMPSAARGGWPAGPSQWIRSANREGLAPDLRDNSALGFRVAWSGTASREIHVEGKKTR